MDEQAQALLERAIGDGRQEFGSFFLSRLFGMEVAYGPDNCIVTFEVHPTSVILRDRCTVVSLLPHSTSRWGIWSTIRSAPGRRSK